MRFTFTLIILVLFFVFKSGAQCTYSCSNYVVSPTVFTMYPAAGHTLQMLDDEVTTTLPIGFNFDFYCTTYNQLRICSNGFITFDFSFISFASTPYAQQLPHSNVPDAVIAWNWNDLDPSQGGTVTYTTLGTWPNQKFVVTYSNVPLWTSTSPPSSSLNTGQIVLNQGTNIIEIHIKEATNNGWLYHTEGIENDVATSGAVVPGRNLSLWKATESSHLFSPYVIGPGTQLSGDTVMCEGTMAAFNTTTVNNALGYHWDFPPGWTASGTQSTITALAGASGNVSVAAIYTCGNSPPSTIAVNVVPAPVLSVSPLGSETVCSGYAFTMQPSGALVYTVEPGGITSTSLFTLYPSGPTVYTISGIANSGCSSIDNPTMQVHVIPSPSISVNSGTICPGESFSLQPSGATNYSYSSFFSVVWPATVGLHTYSVITTGTNGCVSAPAISSVSVAATPVLTITPQPPVICFRQSSTLTAAGAVTYTWNSTGSNSNSITVSPLLTLWFAVAGTDNNGCVGSGTAQVIVDPCLGLGENSNGRLFVFPNPSRGIFHVRAQGVGTYKVVDQLGRMVSSGAFEPGVFLVDLNGSTSGVYYLTISRENEHETVMLLKN